ncbi:MAG: YciI family protein [Novosphingobium sp.]
MLTLAWNNLAKQRYICANQPDPENAMKFLILVKSNPGLEAQIDAMDQAEMRKSMDAMGVFNEELRKAGVLKDCEGLRPTKEAKRVHFDGPTRNVADGPFQGDLVAGYWIWELPSIDEAVAWVKRCPNPMPTPSDIEIRPI